MFGITAVKPVEPSSHSTFRKNDSLVREKLLILERNGNKKNWGPWGIRIVNLNIL